MSLTDRRLLDHDAMTGITSWFHFDPHTHDWKIEDVQDVTALVERNTALWNASEKHSRYGELTRVASIPNVVVMDLAKQGILSPAGAILDDKKFRRWLNDAENQKFRTRAGVV